jgi:hypothetical protein
VNIGTVDYDSSVPPDGYRCSGCDKHGLKLWRGSHSCADAVDLVCCDCIKKGDHEDAYPILDQNGMHDSRYGRSDQFWNGVPAVPVEDGDTFWGYTSVPDAGVKWWRRLPARLL